MAVGNLILLIQSFQDKKKRTESGHSTFHGHDGLWVWIKSYVCKELYKHLFFRGWRGVLEEIRDMSF